MFVFVFVSLNLTCVCCYAMQPPPPPTYHPCMPLGFTVTNRVLYLTESNIRELVCQGVSQSPCNHQAETKVLDVWKANAESGLLFQYQPKPLRCSRVNKQERAFNCFIIWYAGAEILKQKWDSPASPCIAALTTAP